MQEALGHRILHGWIFLSAAFVAVLSLSLWGCGPSARSKKAEPKSTAKAAQVAEVRTDRNFQNAMNALQPDQLGISSDAERAIATLNEWAEAAKHEAERTGNRWEPHRESVLLKSLPQEWRERAALDRFIARDAAYIRDCLWASKAARFAAGAVENDLDRVVNLFAYVVRNLELLPSDNRRVPMNLMDILMLGRGTAEDRAWLFAELLRQRQIDAVILSPPRPENAKADQPWFLVGVLSDRDIFLFDPFLGLPIPADVAEPAAPLPRLPATLRQVQNDEGLLKVLARDSANRFPLTVATMAKPHVELIYNTSLLSWRMRHLQPELSGDLSAVVVDPLEDEDNVAGLRNRVASHPSASWKRDDIAIWSYPEEQLEAASHLDPDQLEELQKLIQTLGAPIRVKQVVENPDAGESPLKFGKPERTLMKLRLQHVLGQWHEVVAGYLGVQLYEIDPPVAKNLEQVSADRKQRRPVAVVATDEKRIMRGLIPPHIRKLHLKAGDDACYWLALCQFEQNRTKIAVKQCRAYLDRYSSGSWPDAAKSLLATCFAKQKRLNEAIRAINDVDEDSPDFAHHKVLIARWRRLLAAEKIE
jgi:hypothetical protein